MLVLSRRSGESIVIADNIVVRILETRGDRVRIGITAPNAIVINRAEVVEKMEQANAKTDPPVS